MNSIFSEDRRGRKIFCRVVRQDDSKVEDFGYARWANAIEGEVIPRLDTVGRGWIDGPWIITKINADVDAYLKVYFSENRNPIG